MSSRYSDQPEFGTDPYSIVIGQPLPKRETHKPMESWSSSHYHPSYGTSTIELYNWDRARRHVSFGEYDEDGVYELSTTFVDSGSGVVEDVHGHYILGGTLLEKVKQDFDRYVIGSWQTARQYDKEFPHHTIVKLSRVLDPTKDPQPKYMNTGAYIEVKRSDIKGYSDMCIFSTSTPKGTNSFQGTIYYFSDGRVGRTESYITRNMYRSFVVKTFIGGLYDTEQIEYIYDSKYGVIHEISKAERRRLMTAKSRWEKSQREERERREREQRREAKAKEAAERRKVQETEKAERAFIAKKKRAESERINQYIIEHYNDCSQSEMARTLGVSTKAVEHRVSRLRQQGLIPIARGSDVYVDQSKRKEEERRKRERKLERAAEKKRKKEEDQARKEAAAREKKERSERMDQYIIDNYDKYTYSAIAKRLGISESSVQSRVTRLRRERRISSTIHHYSFFSVFGPTKDYNPPPFEG